MLERRISEIRSLVGRKKLSLAAAATLGPAAFLSACQTVQTREVTPTVNPTAEATFTPTATPTEIIIQIPTPTETQTPTPTPTPTLAPTPTESPTPEPTPEFTFAEYGVYQANIEDDVSSGGLTLIFLPDGKLLYSFGVNNIECADGGVPFGGGSGNRLINSFSANSFSNNVPSAVAQVIEGSLVDEGTIEGVVRFAATSDRSQNGSGVKCDTGEMPFTANFLGTGRQAVLQAFYPLSVEDVESRCRCELP